MANKLTKGSPMEKLTQGYEKFIEGKELNKSGKKIFETVVKKAVKPKQRGLK